MAWFNRTPNLQSPTWGDRATAAIRLGKQRNRNAIAPLLQALVDERTYQDGAAYVLREVSYALDRIDPTWPQTEGAKAVVPALILSLKDTTCDPPKLIRDILDKIDPEWEKSKASKSAVPEFIRTLTSDPSGELRNNAAHTLASIGDARAIEALVKALVDVDGEVRASARRAVGCIDPLWTKSDGATAGASVNRCVNESGGSLRSYL